MKNIIDEKYESLTILAMREQFVNEYCLLKGWDRFDLTHEQIKIIRGQEAWKKPLMLLS